MSASTTPAPDVVLLAAEWQPRTMLRAQLIEEGFEVVAVDTWWAMERCLWPPIRPRVAVVDLLGLPEPERVLDELPLLFEASHCVIVTAAATLSADAVRARGFRVVSRPLPVAAIIDAAKAAMAASSAPER